MLVMELQYGILVVFMARWNGTAELGAFHMLLQRQSKVRDHHTIKMPIERDMVWNTNALRD